MERPTRTRPAATTATANARTATPVGATETGTANHAAGGVTVVAVVETTNDPRDAIAICSMIAAEALGAEATTTLAGTVLPAPSAVAASPRRPRRGSRRLT